MNLVEPDRKKAPAKTPRLLIVSILLSLVLHILIIILLPYIQQRVAKPQPKPTMVQLVERPKKAKQQQQQKPAKFELDQTPTQPPPKIPVESQRKADQDQRVKREQAPKGDDVRDQKALATPPVPQKRQPVPQQKPQKAVKKVEKPPQKKGTKKAIKPQEKAQPPKEEVVAPPPVPDLSLPPSTFESINRGTLGKRNRSKERDDVEIGDTLSLNLQSSLLASFFRRFHNQIEMVWNYPARAARQGIEGTLYLQITVNRKGELLDVDLLRSSGSDILDYEAIQAVYRAAPFGPLTKHYPHDKLKIRAHFSYQLSGSFIYGN